MQNRITTHRNTTHNMGLFDLFKKKKTTSTPQRPAAIDTMSKADAITQAASKAAEAKAEEEMDELTRLALATGVENENEAELDGDGLIRKALNAIESDDNATAIRCFREAEKQGNLEAKRHLARCYETGRGVGKDEPHAFKMYGDAAKAGCLSAYNNLGNCYIEGIGTPKNPEAGYQAFRTAAEQGEEVAMANVAKCLMQGVGVEKNAEEGLKWFEKSSEAGNGLADFELGMTYLQFPEYREKAEEGLQRVRKAAENGIMDAILVMAQIHDEGGPKQDMPQCLQWLNKAAEKGNKNAQCRLGQILMYGRGGVERDAQKGYHWLSFSAQQGYTPAIYILAELNLLYTNGNQEAMRMGLNQLTQCIKESYPPAFMLMGQCYLEGRAVMKDNAQAVKFFQLSAEHGNINAELLLAKLYNGEVEGAEFETDAAEAKKWIDKAAEKGHPVALHDSAVMTLKGENVTEEERAAAADKLRKAAKAGYTAALKTMTDFGISMQ